MSALQAAALDGVYRRSAINGFALATGIPNAILVAYRELLCTLVTVHDYTPPARWRNDLRGVGVRLGLSTSFIDSILQAAARA